jgi:hypothetical protein
MNKGIKLANLNICLEYVNKLRWEGFGRSDIDMSRIG